MVLNGPKNVPIGHTWSKMVQKWSSKMVQYGPNCSQIIPNCNNFSQQSQSFQNISIVSKLLKSIKYPYFRGYFNFIIAP